MEQARASRAHWALVGQALVGPPGRPCGLTWALVGRAVEGPPGLLWAPLGPCGPGPCGPLLGPCLPTWALMVGPCGLPWVLMGWAPVGPPWAFMG